MNTGTLALMAYYAISRAITIYVYKQVEKEGTHEINAEYAMALTPLLGDLLFLDILQAAFSALRE